MRRMEVARGMLSNESQEVLQSSNPDLYSGQDTYIALYLSSLIIYLPMLVLLP